MSKVNKFQRKLSDYYKTDEVAERVTAENDSSSRTITVEERTVAPSM